MARGKLLRSLRSGRQDGTASFNPVESSEAAPMLAAACRSPFQSPLTAGTPRAAADQGIAGNGPGVIPRLSSSRAKAGWDSAVKLSATANARLFRDMACFSSQASDAAVRDGLSLAQFHAFVDKRARQCPAPG